MGNTETRRDPGAGPEGNTDLSKLRVFFGHQSVGYNLVEGLAEAMDDAGVPRPPFVETRDPLMVTRAAFYHAPIGKNGDPIGKIEDFDAILRTGVGSRVDVAFMKFCYADVDSTTDVGKVFAAYTRTIAKLQSAFPRLTLVHVTVPLTSVETGAKALVKRLLGRPTRSAADNMAREKLSQMLRDEYGATGRLFDLARIESTRADGSRTTAGAGSDGGPQLDPDCTDDGGHLNAIGRMRAGRALLAFLASVRR